MRSLEVVVEKGQKRVDVELDKSHDSSGKVTGQEIVSIWGEHFPGEGMERMAVEFKTFDTTPCSCGQCRGEQYEITATFYLMEESGTKA